MTATLAVTFAGIVLIAVLGFLGRRRPATDLADVQALCACIDWVLERL